MTEDGTHIEQPHTKPPKEETEKPIDFVSLDLWKFFQKRMVTQDKTAENGSITSENKGQVIMDGETYDIHLSIESVHKGEEINNDYISFSILKDNETLMKVKLNIFKNQDPYSATSDIGRNNDPKWNSKLKGKGAQFYIKMLDLLQCYSNEENHDIYHQAIKLSVLSHHQWHSIFDPILASRDYSKITDGGIAKWQKTYHPTKK